MRNGDFGDWDESDEESEGERAACWGRQRRDLEPTKTEHLACSSRWKNWSLKKGLVIWRLNLYNAKKLLSKWEISGPRNTGQWFSYTGFLKARKLLQQHTMHRVPPPHYSTRCITPPPWELGRRNRNLQPASRRQSPRLGCSYDFMAIPTNCAHPLTEGFIGGRRAASRLTGMF